MKCKNCGQELDKKAVVCIGCGCKVKKSVLKKWWFWVIIVIVVAAASSSGSDTSTNKEEPASSTTTVEKTVEAPKKEKKNSPKISKAEFEAIQTGMTYEEVVGIIGGEGELTSQVDVAGYETKMYMWKGEGSIGANANATFQNNSLSSKAQFGLE